MSNQQTTQQERAKAAWDAVSSMEEAPAAKEYGSLVRGLPSQIQRDGLGPTLAFLKAKGKAKDKEHHTALLRHLDGWVLPRLGAEQGRDGLLGYVLTCSSDEYRRAAGETQAYLLWLKRFVEAKNLGEAG